MEMWIGDLLVDASPPEKPKFRGPLVLVHGLWTGGWCWQNWATHFCNLGWECWAINFRGRFEEERDRILRQLTFERCVEDLKKILRRASFPPVLLGHGLGAWAAQKAAEDEKVSALILLSSLPPKGIAMEMARGLRLLRLKYSPLIFLRRPFRIEDRDLRRLWLASLPEDQQPDILRRAVPDSPHLAREFFERRTELFRERLRCPVLVLGGGGDRVVPIGALRTLTRWLGAELKEYPRRGHWMLGEEGGEAIVRDIHRWVVQKLGDKILLAEFSEQQ
jgi:pimeloyl-ACP methyl ester carboxylesterase